MKHQRTNALKVIDAGRRPALASIVEERLREAIMFGELALGEPVSEDRLATRLGVSRTPVREALTALQMQGMINILPQRGSYVFSPVDADVLEICEYRYWVEQRALTLAHERDKAATLVAMTAAQADLEAAENAASASDAARADAAFHTAFIDRSGNRLLVQAYALVSGRVGAIRFFARRSGGARSYSGAQHREIITAFADGDLDHACAVLRQHVMNMRAHFLEAKQSALAD